MQLLQAKNTFQSVPKRRVDFSVRTCVCVCLSADAKRQRTQVATLQDGRKQQRMMMEKATRTDVERLRQHVNADDADAYKGRVHASSLQSTALSPSKHIIMRPIYCILGEFCATTVSPQ